MFNPIEDASCVLKDKANRYKSVEIHELNGMLFAKNGAFHIKLYRDGRTSVAGTRYDNMIIPSHIELVVDNVTGSLFVADKVVNHNVSQLKSITNKMKA